MQQTSKKKSSGLSTGHSLDVWWCTHLYSHTALFLEIHRLFGWFRSVNYVTSIRISRGVICVLNTTVTGLIMLSFIILLQPLLDLVTSKQQCAYRYIFSKFSMQSLTGTSERKPSFNQGGIWDATLPDIVSNTTINQFSFGFLLSFLPFPFVWICYTLSNINQSIT